jgi:hypothetical protein
MNAGKRRIGLRREDFNGPSLHGNTINNAGNSRSGSCSGLVQARFKPEVEDEDEDEDEDDDYVNRSPQSSDKEDTEFLLTNFKLLPSSPRLTKQNLRENDFNAVREQTVLSTSSEAQIGSSPLRSYRPTKDTAGSQTKKIRTEPFKEEQAPDILFGMLKPQNRKRPKTSTKYSAKSKWEMKASVSSGDSPVSSFKLPPDSMIAVARFCISD